MKNVLKPFGIIVLVTIIGLAMAGCATFATNQHIPQKTTPILGTVSGSLLPQGEEIASYTKFMGICIGYDEFLEAVAGKDYDVVEKFLFVINKVYAISK